jgi:hypothetical protein
MCDTYIRSATENLFCASFLVVFLQGDVMGALPKALAARGHRVMAVAPRYGSYEDAWETGVRLRIKVFGQDHEVGFFHSYVDGVDHVFIGKVFRCLCRKPRTIWWHDHEQTRSVNYGFACSNCSLKCSFCMAQQRISCCFIVCIYIRNNK